MTVVVLGLGMLGLTSCAWSASRGRRVIACDVDDVRLAQARKFSATHAARPAELPELVRAVTNGRGADLALELSGSPAANALSLDLLRIGGTAVWVGAVYPVDAVSVLPETMVRRCLTVTGIHNYTPDDLGAAIAFLSANHSRFPFADLVAREFTLDSVDEAFAFAERERPVRVAIRT